jgi:enamine deaminase RidA (YjgF/YER057c/UK114 family)
MYLTNREHSEVVCKAHGEYFSEIRPASCLVIVKGLILPELLVEMECDAEI